MGGNLQKFRITEDVEMKTPDGGGGLLKKSHQEIVGVGTGRTGQRKRSQPTVKGGGTLGSSFAKGGQLKTKVGDPF